MKKRKEIFVIMPFSTTNSRSTVEWTSIYENIFKPAIENCGAICSRAVPSTGSLIKGIVEKLEQSDIVLADITDQNANVFYELGVRHALSKRTIIVSHSVHDIPSDLKGYWSIIYGEKADEVRKFKKDLKRIIEQINRIPNKSDSPVSDYIQNIINDTPFLKPDDIRERMHMLQVANSPNDILLDIKEFIEHTIYAGRRVRIAFARKITEGSRTILRDDYLVPTGDVKHEFSYPQTLASWALITGEIFAFPAHLKKKCDFKLLKMLRKYDRIIEALLQTDPELDHYIKHFLDAEQIKQKSTKNCLQIKDIYQHWVGEQPIPHYSQFISVPVPIVDRVVGHKEPPEYGVFNIDTLDKAPLLTERTEPLLKLAADIVAIGFKRILKKNQLELL